MLLVVVSLVVCLLLVLYRARRKYLGLPGAGLQLPFIGHYQVRRQSLIGHHQVRRQALIGHRSGARL